MPCSSYSHHILVGLLALLAGGGPPLQADTPSVATQPAIDPVDVAQAFARHLEAAEFEQAAGLFNDRVRSLMGPDKLREVWQSLPRQCGPFGGFGTPRSEPSGADTLVLIPGRWKDIPLDMRVSVGRDGKVAGLLFRPAAAETKYNPPAYVNQKRFRERDLEIGDAPWKLKARLTCPLTKKRHPGVVLVHGSGPNDMDETLGPSMPFRDLAWGLASQGIVVLRYDKRTKAYGEKMTPADTNPRVEVIDDALAALAVLRRQGDVNPSQTFLVGHSLGGCLAPVIAADDGKLAGVIILAGTLRPMEMVIVDQLEYIASLGGAGEAETRKLLDEARAAIDRMNKPGAPAEGTILGAPIAYWRDLSSCLGQRGAEAIQSFDGRVLVLNGGRDYQITRKDYDLWDRLLDKHPRATLRWLPNMNHLFAAGEGMARPDDYAKKEQHVDETVIRGLAAWINSGEYPAAGDTASKEPG